MENSKKSLLVFGGSGGLGLEICKKFLSADFNLFFTSQNKKKIKQLLSSLENNESNLVKGFHCEASNEKDFKKIIKNFYKLESNNRVIINCIGSFNYDGIEAIDVKKLAQNFRVNVYPTVLINKYVNEFKTKREKVKIFSIGSSSSYDGFNKTIAYCSSKHALLGAVRSLNKELISKNIYNINVNPGSIKTKMGKKVRNQKFSEFIKPETVANFLFDISNLNEPAFIEDVYLKRIVK